jgi:hypothetical protein
MNSQIINANQESTLARIDGIETMAEVINSILSHYPATQKVELTWSPLKLTSKGTLESEEANTLSQLVKRSQDARQMGTEGDDKATRRLEFQAVKAVFDLENISALIEATYHKLGYQRRFTGQSKKGVGTITFTPSAVAKKDVIGRKAEELEAQREVASLRQLVKGIHGKDMLELVKEGHDVEELVRQAKAAKAQEVKAPKAKE